MDRLDSLRFRAAGSADAERIAALHADSWRRHYRGAYSDTFLDGDVAADRLALWRDRLAAPDPGTCTVLAEDDQHLLGFAHTVLDHDPVWGALLDNLHVTHGHRRHGIGSALMAESAVVVVDRSEASGLYLWVLEQNVAAQAFYEARGGKPVGRALVRAPGGVAGRLNGSPAGLRYAWPSPAALITR